MRYIIIIILGLSLPATALVSTVSKNTPSEIKITATPSKSEQKAEALRKIIQNKTGHRLCDPDKELKMPTFY